MRTILFFISCTLLILSCNQTKEGTGTTKTSTAGLTSGQIVGQWVNIDLTIDFNYGDTSLSAQSIPNMVVDSFSWEQKLQIKPIKTTFREDSSWTSVYRNLYDSIVAETTGRWWLAGDSMVFRTLQPSPAPDEMLHVTLNDGTIMLRGLVDFDQDGLVDDLYLGRQRRAPVSN